MSFIDELAEESGLSPEQVRGYALCAEVHCLAPADGEKFPEMCEFHSELMGEQDRELSLQAGTTKFDAMREVYR